MATSEAFPVICAIDLGTSCSGYSYLFLSDPEKVINNPPWPNTPGSYEKTATEILLSGDGNEVLAFGHEARHRLAGMSETEAKSVLHFHHFKMFLDPKTVRATKVKANNCDVCVSLVLVISKVLETIRKAAINQFKSNGTTVTPQQVKWVLTVPAIWDSAAKQVMMEAAGMAGLGNERNVLLALEPEAASLTCMRAASLPIEFRRPGTRYMVIDAGGGTVDITVHEIQTDLTVHELLKASGGAWGSSYVDEAILKLMEEIFGQEAMSSVKRTPEWVEVVSKIELAKMSLTLANLTDGSKKNIEAICLQDFVKGSLRDLVEAYNKRNKRNLEFSRGYLRVPPALLKQLMDPLIHEIVAHVTTNLLPKVNVSLVFLVGGFAQSEILQHEIKRAFETTARRVVIPVNPGLSVVTGAALFGLNPGVISSRCAPYTYGIEMLEPWNASKHNLHKKVVMNHKEYCQDVLDIFIHCGNFVDLMNQVKRKYVPVTPEQTEVELPVFRSTASDPVFTTDANVKYVGSLKMAIPGVGRPANERQVEVCMKFGGTNVEVSALHVLSGEKVTASYREYLNDGELPPRPAAISETPREASTIDLMFAMDCTGSMSSWIAKTKAEAITIAQQVHTRFPRATLRCGFIGYRDIQDNPRHLIFNFAMGAEDMTRWLEGVGATGGGDTPEDILGALLKVSEQGWSSSVRVLVHIADAPCHGKQYHSCDDSYPQGDPNGLTPEFVLGKLAALKIDYYFMQLNSITATMEGIFSGIYSTLSGKPIRTIITGSNVAALLPSVVECVTRSVTAFQQSL